MLAKLQTFSSPILSSKNLPINDDKIRKQNIQNQSISDIFSFYSKLIIQSEDIIDDFIMSTIESNSDLFLYYKHICNVYKIYDMIFEEIEAVNEEPIIEEFSHKISVEVSTPVKKHPPSPPRTYNTRSKDSKGGAPGIACDGDMILDGDPLHQAFLTASICKTYEELAHDFDKPEYLKAHLHNLEDVYNKVISVFVSRLNETTNPELNKIKGFIENLQRRRYNKEWNYYTSVLEHLDKSCGSIDDIVIIKTKKIENPGTYMGFSHLCNDGFIINVDGSLYNYSTIDNRPVEPIFTMTDFYCRFSDNPTANKKLWPLLFEPKIGDHNIKLIPDAHIDFSNFMCDIKYAPGLLDPKTTGPYSPSLFTKEDIHGIPPEIMVQIQNLQAMQNINIPENSFARTCLMDGINNFIKYFGSHAVITDPNTLQFVEDTNHNFCGVSFTINEVIVELYYGDTTIQNISDFINLCGGIIPETVNPAWKISWKRLHTFSKIILYGIPAGLLLQITSFVSRDELLTHIFISLKSFGDSLQVYYAKRMQTETNRNLSPYISTTDKNVAAESLLIHSDVCVIGTGIRPHVDFSDKYPEFFRVKGSDKEDGCKTITTNKGTLTIEKALDNVTNTFFNFLEYVDVARTSVVEETFGFTIEEMVDFLTLQPFLNNTGKEQIERLKNAYTNERDETERIKILSKLDKFLKKSLDIIKLCEPQTDTEPISEAISEAISEPVVEHEIANKPKNLLFQRLDVVTTFIKTTVVSQLKHLRSVKIDLLKSQGTFERIAEKINSASFTNICDEDLVGYARSFLNPDYQRSIEEVQTKYTELLETTKNDITSSLTNLISFKIPVATRETQPRKVKATAAERVEEERKLDFEMSQIKIINKIEEIKRSLENTGAVLKKMQMKEHAKLEKKLEVLNNKLKVRVDEKITKHKNSLNLQYVKEKVVNTFTSIKNTFDSFYTTFNGLKGGSIKTLQRSLTHAFQTHKNHTKKNNPHKISQISRKKIHRRKYSKKQKKKNSRKKQRKHSRKNNIII
jgi:ribosomal protein S8